jgi:RNA polymerase sigma-70 factor (ECF subfamily)
MVLEASMIHLGSKVNMISELDDIDELVRVYRSRVLRYVVYSIKDQDLAETITQDCFLKAYAGRASFRGDCSVSTWLMSIANNLMRDRLRTRKVQFWRKAAATSLDITEMAAFLPSGESTAENSLLARERLQRVVDALDELSVNQRAIFIMKFSEEMDPTEIAQAIGMPVNTVKTHLHRAITAIRKHLGNTV